MSSLMRLKTSFFPVTHMRAHTHTGATLGSSAFGIYLSKGKIHLCMHCDLWFVVVFKHVL